MNVKHFISDSTQDQGLEDFGANLQKYLDLE